MSDLDSVSISAHRRGVPLAMVAAPLVLLVVVLVGATREGTPAPEPPERPADLSDCRWDDPDFACRRDGPRALATVPSAWDVGDRLGKGLIERVEGGSVRLDWLETPGTLPDDVGTAGEPYPLLPNPYEGAFVADDLVWFAIQPALVASGPVGWPRFDYAIDEVPVEPEAPRTRAADALYRWRYTFQRQETSRRAAFARAWQVEREQSWREASARHAAALVERERWGRYWLYAGVALVFLLPLFAVFGWVVRRRSLVVRCTRTHLIIDGEPVELTRLPVDPVRLRDVVRVLLPAGYAFGPDEHGFGAALERAVAAQHAAEDRPEERARLGALQARTAE